MFECRKQDLGIAGGFFRQSQEVKEAMTQEVVIRGDGCQGDSIFEHSGCRGNPDEVWMLGALILVAHRAAGLQWGIIRGHVFCNVMATGAHKTLTRYRLVSSLVFQPIFLGAQLLLQCWLYLAWSVVVYSFIAFLQELLPSHYTFIASAYPCTKVM